MERLGFVLLYVPVEKNILILIKMVRYILFKTIAIGVKNVTIGERDQAQDSHYGERAQAQL